MMMRLWIVALALSAHPHMLAAGLKEDHLIMQGDSPLKSQGEQSLVGVDASPSIGAGMLAGAAVSGSFGSGSLAGNTSPAPMQDALRLSMGSLMGFCRCESCEQVIGDLIDNLEDDFPGRTYQEGDVYALINDRFCYGVRWVFRSSCRYILSKYMDETIQLLMMEASEREVCETLRFCW